MSDLIIEVEEAMKQERLEKLWQKYGSLLIGFLLALVLGTALNSGYKSWKTSKNEKQTAIYLSVLEQESLTSEDLLKITPDLHGNFRAMAELQAAGLALDSGETDKAIELYKTVAHAPYASDDFSALAAYMVLNHSNNIEAANKIAQLESIQANDENAWRYHAMLDLALIYANDAQDYTKARTYLNSIIASATAPQSLQKKAQSFDLIYATKETVAAASTTKDTL